MSLPSDAQTSRDILQPVALIGRSVQLVPLSLDHHDGLVDAVRDGELWKLWFTNIPSPEEMHGEIVRRLGLHRSRSMLPFTVIGTETSQIVGMTTFMNIDIVNRRVEIGSTWYAERVQRSALNTEAKLLLLTHAFDELDVIAVEFRTHIMNHRSRRAIERLGAKMDGILRSHSVAANGTVRDTCVYSVIAPEWPAVRAHLQGQLTRSR